MNKFTELAELIFPDVKLTIEDLEKQYSSRDLKEGSAVTRFAPSPTGFLHTGSLFTSLIGYKVASQSGGVFYFRLEDTDQKREIAGSGAELIEQLKIFGISPSEGYLGDHEEGIYGPYVQSQRAEIYKVVIKEMLARDLAYPCFCEMEELNQLRESQEGAKVIPGYYGPYAKCRYYSVDEAIEKIKSGMKYVIRFKSQGNHLNKIKIHDLIRGDLELSENDQDIVIFKSDGLPTYHFAHLCDDHFMRTTIVTRGEEWLPSLPIHLELFKSLGFEAPSYAHLPVIMKLDNGNKRKLSKRKDSEAAVSFFLEAGYPVTGILKYLMTIANSNFEEWLIANPTTSWREFNFTFEKMSLDGALFDMPKLQNLSKDTLSYYTKEEITDGALDYARSYAPKLLDLINRDRPYFEAIMNIERNQEKPRKDYEKYSDIFDKVKFFYDDYYEELMDGVGDVFNDRFSKEFIKLILTEFRDSLDLSCDESTWFANLKELGAKHGFADAFKLYKKNPENYKGHVGDVAEMVRIAITGSKMSPNLFCSLSILGKERVIARINKTISLI